MKLVDTHCHLYLPKFDSDLNELLNRSATNGVDKIFLPAIDSQTHQRVIDLAAKKDAPVEIFAMMGLHPCSVQANFEQELEIIKQNLDSGQKYYAVGEIGLDYHWSMDYKEQQIVAFERQIEWAIQRELPIVIHSRNSTADSINCVQKYKGSARGIFHCFSGTPDEAKAIIDLGFYLGIGGTCTYKNSNHIAILKEVGLKNVVLETDAPYLAPVPYKGKRNEPSYIKLIAEALAQGLNKPVEEIAEITTANALQIFGVAA